MKKFLFILSLFIALSAFGQNNERITLKGKAKLLSTWTWKSEKEVSSVLSNGDKLIVKMKAQAGVEALLMHNNSPKKLLTINESEDLFIQCYEYDFDSDGNNEIIIASSSEIATLDVYVFKYIKGVSELVGSFAGTYEIELNKNEIYLPMGSQGLGSVYGYRKGVFYEMIYHNPKVN